jgi:hypothetical protein
MLIGERVYLEFRPFQEIVITRGGLEPTPQPLLGYSWVVVAPNMHIRAGSGC